MQNRKKTKKIKVGNIYIGGNAPISIQSMTNTDTANLEKTVSQIKKLEKTGCEIIRVAVPNMASAKNLEKLKAKINIPLVADIHFSHQLALESIIPAVIRSPPGTGIPKSKGAATGHGYKLQGCVSPLSNLHSTPSYSAGVVTM